MKKKILIYVGGILIIFTLYFIYTLRIVKVDEMKVVSNKGKLITDVYSDKSKYNLKENVNITIEMENKLNKNFNGRIDIFYKYLDKQIGEDKVSLEIKNGDKKTINFKWLPPNSDFKGYIIEVYAVEKENVIDKKNSAVDVSSDWSKFPRYGYIANYPEQSKETSAQVIERLNKFHINGIQFYDWQYKHNMPLAGSVNNPAKTWKDIANRDTYGQTVKDYINLSHDKNMMAANYNLMFGAYYNYEADGVKPQWGMYKDPDHEGQDFHPLPSEWASSELYMFNPANPGWQKYIFNAEKQAMKVYNFDVWHVDTLGPRGYIYDYNGKDINLFDTYSGFLNNAKKALGKRIVMNAVNEYGQIEVAKKSDVDFLYAEIWPPDYTNYGVLKTVTDNVNTYTNGKKATVIAAYMNYGIADNIDEFNSNSVKLTDASIFASGGAHIELGDTGMLSKEYYPSANLKMSKSLENDMRKYYDFSVAYENLLRDGLNDSKNEIEIPNFKISADGSANTIWTYAKEKKGFETIQLINLLGVNYSNWRDDLGTCKMPPVKENFKLKYYISQTNIKNVYLASPDMNEGSYSKLKYTKGKDNKGNYLEIHIPKLIYWDMIYIEK